MMFKIVWLSSYKDEFGCYTVNNSMETNNFILDNKVATKHKLFSAMRALGYEIPKGTQVQYEEYSIYLNARNGKLLFELQKV